MIYRLGQPSSLQITPLKVGNLSSLPVITGDFQGMLATVTGLQGGAHNGLGEGFGGLLGGITIETTKSTHRAFWLFGVVCAAISFVYILLISGIAFKHKKSGGTEKETFNRRVQRGNSIEEQKSYEKKDGDDENKIFLEDDLNLSY